MHWTRTSATFAPGDDPINWVKPSSFKPCSQIELDPSNGSHDRKRTAAAFLKRKGSRFSANVWFSTLVPNQTFVGQSLRQGTSLSMFCGRFVRRSQSRFGVFWMSSQRRVRCSFRSERRSKTSAMLAQKTLSRVPASPASSFHLSGSRQCASPKNRRGAVCAPKLVAHALRPQLRIAVVASRRNLIATPPGIKCVVRPFNVGVLCHYGGDCSFMAV